MMAVVGCQTERVLFFSPIHFTLSRTGNVQYQQTTLFTEQSRKVI